jgi:epoxyqueuosine reductase QueG
VKTLDAKVLFDSICDEVNRFLKKDPSNVMGGTPGNEPIWAAPLLGVARGDDPIFETFRETVDPRHWSPIDAFVAGGYEGVSANELSVVSWVLPHTAATRKENAPQKEWPSERWVRSRVFGETANMKLRDHMVAFLKNLGRDAVSPMRLEGWTELRSDRYVFASNWSERHVAHACGLGTFGLCDGLITPVGKSVRIGSLVLRARLEPTPRPYTRHDEYCSFKTKGNCGACIKRCPIGALSEQGHDKIRCRTYLNEKTAPYVMENFKFEGYGCGLCQTGVPCASSIPKLN